MVTVASLLAVGACAGDDVPAATGGADGLVSVGTSVATWSEDSAPAGGVTEDDFTALLRTQDEYDSWLDGLPHQDVTRDPLTAEIDFTDSVALVAAHPICDESIRVLTDGAGTIASDAVPPADPASQFVCEWSPLRVNVYEIPLADLGVDSAGQVVLDPTLVEP
ncbi:hypothetical protein [Georgenia sp. Z1491]|uniref:hypothetical protein n=1 Tax=Georgenia sp. Z1491 TaxID=3416707 RepID=UPI003CF462A0